MSLAEDEKNKPMADDAKKKKRRAFRRLLAELYQFLRRIDAILMSIEN